MRYLTNLHHINWLRGAVAESLICFVVMNKEIFNGMPKITHRQSKNPAYSAWMMNKVRGRLAVEWADDFNKMYKVVGDPPSENMRLVRIRKEEILGPDNWRWRSHKRIKQGEFRNTILEIVKAADFPISIRDIRHILVTEYGEPSRLLHNVVYVNCKALLEKGALARTKDKVQTIFSDDYKQRAFGYYIPEEKVEDNRKILWIVRNTDFKSSKLKPDRIIYDENLPVIRHQLVGRYRGVDRIPMKLQSNEYYEAKGWRVIEL